jgi:hypothetical protein
VPEVRVRHGAGALDAALLGLPNIVDVWIDDSLTYHAIRGLAVQQVALRATNFCRPLVRTDPAAAEWVFTGADASATLTLDGLFVSGGTHLVLKGTFARVTLRCCTLDPGTWEANPEPPATPGWRLAADAPRKLEPSRLRIEGNVRVLEIDRCILGPISSTGTFGAEIATVQDTIIQAADPDPDERALSLTNGAIALSRCTVLGKVEVHRLDASESILHDVATVDDTQHGCVRFTAWSSGSKLPRKYESAPISPQADLFGSRAFGQPAFAQLIATAGAAILEGAEDGSEMGAFCREKSAIKERSILIKYQEYLPLGLEPSIVHVT